MESLLNTEFHKGFEISDFARSQWDNLSIKNKDEITRFLPKKGQNDFLNISLSMPYLVSKILLDRGVEYYFSIVCTVY